MLDIAFAKSALPETGALVLLLEEGGGPDAATGATLKAADAATAAPLAARWRPPSSTAARARSAPSWRPAPELSRVVAIGIGKLDAS